MQKDRAQEEAYLTQTEKEIEGLQARLRASLDGRQEALLKQRTDLWEDAKHQIWKTGIDTFDEMVEILQGATQLEHDEQMRRDDLWDLERLERMKRTPYFGRVDFCDAWGETEVYVGIGTLEGEQDFFVYDWRSPVASLYYKSGVGPASYHAPMGELRGEITRKRQYVIEDSRLKYYFDTDVEISDGILKEALSKPGAQKLKTIVTTIQTEQNQAIRKPWRKNLLITGPAGCGKTSVGMHRLAWILYENRKKIKVEKMAIFTQSNLFADYITGVLPALGEREIGKPCLEELLEKACPGLEVEDLPAFTQRLLGDAAAMERAKCILSPAFRERLETVLSAPVDMPPLTLCGEVLVSGQEMTERYARDREYPPRIRLNRLIDYGEEVVESYFAVGEEREDKPVRRLLEAQTEEAAYLPMEEVLLIYRHRPVSVFRKKAEACLPHDLQTVYADLSRQAVGEGFAERAEKGNIWFEDALALAYLKLQLEGRYADISFDHILIDEAQDYPLLAHRLIRGLFPEAVFTLLADRHQGLLPGISPAGDALQDLYQADRVSFNRSFRSTRQIAAYAQTLTEDRYEIFARDGEPVSFMESALLPAILQILPTLQEQETLCIITQTAQQARMLYEAIKNDHPCDLITGREGVMRHKILISPVVFTKGLEFDRVILPEELFSDQGRSRYLAATRALHRLYCLRPPRV